LETELRSEIPYEQLCDEVRQQGIAPPEIKVILGSAKGREPIEFANLRLTSLERYYESMPWGFTLNFDEYDEEHSCRAIFDAGIYDPAGVRELVGRFQRLLDAVAYSPDVNVEELLAMRFAAN